MLMTQQNPSSLLPFSVFAMLCGLISVMSTLRGVSTSSDAFFAGDNTGVMLARLSACKHLLALS